MADIEKVNKALKVCMSAKLTCADCPYNGTDCTNTLNRDALKLLKWFKAKEDKWYKTICDNQYANAPDERYTGEEHAYKKGLWDGLQMALDIMKNEG